MKIKIPKPYWVIGSLAAASIIIVGGYNMITANNNKTIVTSNEDIIVQQKDYSDEIEELKQRLANLESKVLELETSNKEKEINSLSRDMSLLKKQVEKLLSLNNDVSTLKEQMEKLLSFIIIEDYCPERTVNINFKVPEWCTNQELKITIKNDIIYKCNIQDIDKEITITATSKGIQSLKIYIDDNLYKIESVDFRTETTITI